MDEAVTMMENETDYIILDVRTPEEFAEKHISNAINIPNETIGNEPIPKLPREDHFCYSFRKTVGLEENQKSA